MVSVYLKVPPLHIRDQKEEFGTHFFYHENEEQRDIIEHWRKALEVVVDRCHHRFIYETNRYMEELITVICNRISSMLTSVTFRIAPTWFVSHVKDVIRMLEKDGGGVCMVGICGQSGIGKTTIAKAIYDQLSHEFAVSAFIPNGQPLGRRTTPFEGRKVLVVFDDVDGLDSFESHQNLLGKGSKIIVIAKEKKDLDSSGVKEDNIYFAHELNNRQSLRLFGYHAFKDKQPTTEIVELARKVTEFAGGMPLGLAVLGSLFSSMRTQEEWESILQKLSSALGEGIDRVLKVSMDALHPNQLQIFFDIVCRLIGSEKEYATYMWEDCEWSPTDGIEVLQQRSLISIDAEGRFRMHDKIRDMCRSMVENGELKIWNENGLLVAFPDWEDWQIEGIKDSLRMDLRPIQIEAMENLRFLHLRTCHVEYNCLQPLKNLRWLRMERCDVNGSIFDEGGMLEKLIVLQLHNCRANAGNKHQGMHPGSVGNRQHIFQFPLGKRWSLRKKVFKKLKVLEIIHRSGVHDETASDDFRLITDVGIASLDFSLMPSLVKLMIESSWRFDQIPQSIWGLRKLEFLRITCTGLEKLPSSINNLSSLQTLDFQGCVFLSKLPEGLGDLAALRELLLPYCVSLEEIPSFVVKLNHLRTLIVSGCRSLHRLPQLPSSLITLDAARCVNLRQVADISNLQYLTTLNLERCAELQDVAGLHNLKSLQFLKLPFHIS